MYADPVGHQTLNVIAEADAFNRWMYESIKPYLKGNILEIGSGIGNISKFVLRDDFQVTLSDYNAGYCHYLEEHLGHFTNLQGILSIDLQQEHFYEKYSSLKSRFDTIYLLNVVEHLADDAKAITFCRFLLKNGGNLIILVPAFQFLFCRLDKNLGHFRRYSAKRLGALLQTGFTIRHRQYLNALGITGWLLFGKLLRRPVLQQQEMQTYNRLVPFAKLADRFLNRLFGLSIVFIAQKI